MKQRTAKFFKSWRIVAKSGNTWNSMIYSISDRKDAYVCGPEVDAYVKRVFHLLPHLLYATLSGLLLNNRCARLMPFILDSP